MQEAKHDTALILPGGGARAAYQVGVIKALATLHGNREYNPYRILCGTSAGAINAVALATKAENFGNAADWLESLWLNLSTDQIYRSDWLGVMSNAWRLLLSLFNSGIAVGRPVALLDNSPLHELLRKNLDFGAISENIAAGHLEALSLTAMDYTQGVSISFFQGGPERAGWQRCSEASLAAMELMMLGFLAAQRANKKFGNRWSKSRQQLICSRHIYPVKRPLASICWTIMNR